MAQKTALLIGVTEYGEGIPNLTAPANDVAAFQRVLEDPAMGRFDRVQTLVNPGGEAMREAILTLFDQASKDDFVLLFFSGHGITDDNNHLYLTTQRTAKHNFEATAVPAQFVQQRSARCYAKRQVIILDCCCSGAFKEGWHLKSVGLDLRRDLGIDPQGGEGRAVLTSSSATQTSFQQDGAELSLYTQYLVEGIETGIADSDRDGNIFIQELHQYAKAKVQEAKPKQKPEIILDKEGFNILISHAPLKDPKLRFRREAEEYASQNVDYLQTHGDFSPIGKITLLQAKRKEIGLTESEAQTILDSIREPYRRQLENQSLYRQAVEAAFGMGYPLSESVQRELEILRNTLGVRDTEAEEIEHQTEAPARAAWEQQQQELQQEQQRRAAERQQQEKERQRKLEQERIAQEQREQAERERNAALEREQSEREEAERQRRLEQERLVELERKRQEEKQRQQSMSAAQARAKTAEPQAGQKRSLDLGEGVNLTLVYIPGGTFWMGPKDDDPEARDSEKPRHQVTVPAFWMGETPVTQAQYKAVRKNFMGMGKNPSHFKGDNRPVETVSWNEAIQFCQELSNKVKETMTLPSESQWEYACRAGTETFYCFGDDTGQLETYAWYGNNSDRQTHPVKQKKPNSWELYDMHGNVWEWCLDHWHGNYQGAPTDGSAWLSSDESKFRLLRGGSWDLLAGDCRSAYRNNYAPDNRDVNLGFRVVCRSSRTP